MERIGRIGVLMGGSSSEREISLKSGRAVYQALKEEGLDVVPFDIGKSSLNKIKCAGLSVAFIALHGKFGEDGTLQRELESLGIPYTGSGVESSSLCMDKLASRRILEGCGIPVPESFVLVRESWEKDLKKLEFELPVVVKPSSQGSSIGITFVQKSAGLNAAAACAFNYDDKVIIEKYITGREITVGILDGNALPVIEIAPEKGFFDFQAKYERGRTEYLVPAKLPRRQYKRAQETGLLAHQALGCRGVSRVDMILSRGRPFVLEVNTIPGLTSSSLLPMAARAQGVSFSRLCLKIVHEALKKKKQEL